MAAMVASNEAFRPGAQHDVVVVDLNSAGAGVARLERLVLFVPGLVPGDRARVRIDRLKKNVAEGSLIELHHPAAARREPPCVHQSRCGGCPTMVLDESAQLAFKARHLAETVRRIAQLTPPPVETIAAPPSLGYRSRVRFGVAPRQVGAVLGFHPRGEQRWLVPIDSCAIAPPRASQLAHVVLERLNDSTAPQQECWIDGLELRGSLARQEWIAVLLGPAGRWPGLAATAEALCREQADLVGIGRIERPSERPLPVQRLAGRLELVESFGNVAVELGASGFSQVNPPTATLLYQRIRSLLRQAAPLESVLDLFCGVGLAGLVASDPSTTIVGIESDEEAVQRARQLALQLGRPQATFRAADARGALRQFASAGERFEVAIVNPPHAGLGADLAPLLAALAPRAIAMVSCHPAALARDLSGLAGCGYRLTELVAVDMFPQTAELEAIALMVTGG